VKRSKLHQTRTSCITKSMGESCCSMSCRYGFNCEFQWQRMSLN